MKITGLQSRLEDNRSHEELLTAKFNSLNKSIEEIRMANEITKGTSDPFLSFLTTRPMIRKGNPVREDPGGQQTQN
jgi:hypothetical protein